VYSVEALAARRGLILQDPVTAFNSVGLVAACQILFRKPGTDSSFFSAGAWQAGQSVSGAALIFCSTSMRCSQDAH